MKCFWSPSYMFVHTHGVILVFINETLEKLPAPIKNSTFNKEWKYFYAFHILKEIWTTTAKKGMLNIL